MAENKEQKFWIQNSVNLVWDPDDSSSSPEQTLNDCWLQD